MSDKLLIFTDGSVNTTTKIGYGAYLAVSELSLPIDSLKKLVKVKRFEDTSSTKLELQTLLFALRNIQSFRGKVIIYTDSQNIIGLPGRRERFEKNDYYSKNGKRIGNYLLYQEFFRITDRLKIELYKVEGHKPSNQKNETDRIFNLVDKASRKALRDAIT